MNEPLTASKLRENVYRILDEVLETGVPVEIERRGKILKIVPALELQDLFEIQRAAEPAAVVLAALTRELGLGVYDLPCA